MGGSSVRSLSRTALVNALVRYKFLPPEKAVEALLWKLPENVREIAEATPDPFQADIEGVSLMLVGDPMTRAFAMRYGIKIAVIKLIFQNGS